MSAIFEASLALLDRLESMEHKGDDAEWSCPLCTLSNPSQASTCEICSADRYGAMSSQPTTMSRTSGVVGAVEQLPVATAATVGKCPRCETAIEKPPTAKMWQCQACGAHMVANVKTGKFVLYASQSERMRREGSFTSKKDRAYNVRQETTQQFGLYTSSILQDPLPCVPEAAGAAGATGETAGENATTTILSLESRPSATQHRFGEVDPMGWRGRGHMHGRVQCSENRNQVLPVTHYAHTVDASALRDGLHGADGFDGKGGSCGASGSSGGTGGRGGRGGDGQRGHDGKLTKRPSDRRGGDCWGRSHTFPEAEEP